MRPGDAGLAGELVALTERTITDRAVVLAVLSCEAVRTSGIAEAVGEREPNLNALAVLVIGRGDELVAILGLQAPAARLPASTRRALRAPLRRAASETRAIARRTGIGLAMLGSRGRSRSLDLRVLADEELMGLVRDGEVQAFEVIFDRQGPAAFSLAYRMCGRRAAAEDIVQDAFLSLWRSASGYDPRRGSVRSWVLSVVHNRAIDAFRRQGSRTVATFPTRGSPSACRRLTPRTPRSSAAMTPGRSEPRSTSSRPTSAG